MKFTQRKKLIVVSSILMLFAFVSFSFRESAYPPPEKRMAKNLKVLPKGIDHMALIKIMHDFCDALEYKCGDCHAAAANPTKPGELDFASDANPKKETARHMMKMMMKINKKYFKVKGGFAENYVNAKYDITCYSCHHGSEHPKTFPEMKDRKQGMRPPPDHKPANN